LSDVASIQAAHVSVAFLEGHYRDRHQPLRGVPSQRKKSQQKMKRKQGKKSKTKEKRKAEGYQRQQREKHSK